MVHHIRTALLALLLSSTVASAQTFPGLGTNGYPLVSQGPSATPTYVPLTNAGLAQMPADTVKCNNTVAAGPVLDCTSIILSGTTASSSPITGTAVVGGGFGAGKGSYLGTITNKILRADNASNNYLNDQLYIGGATLAQNIFDFSTLGNDWLSQFYSSLGVGSPGPLGFATLGVLNNNYPLNAYGIVSGVQTAHAATDSAAYEALSIYGVNNGPSIHSDQVWALYGECHRVSGSGSNSCIGIEFDLRNAQSPDLQPDPFQQTLTTNMQMTCGMGFTSSPFNCGSVLEILNNLGKWNGGIIFGANSIDSTGPVVNGNASFTAIAMPDQYQIQWYSANTVVQTAIYAGGAGSLNIATPNIIINGTAAVNCGPGITFPNNTFTVVHGIVTVC